MNEIPKTKQSNQLEIGLDVITSIEIVVANGKIWTKINNANWVTAANCDHVIIKETRL